MRSISCKTLTKILVPAMLATVLLVTLEPHVAYAQEDAPKSPLCVTSACTRGELEQVENENEEGSFMQLKLHVRHEAKSAAVPTSAPHDQEESILTPGQTPVQMMLPWLFELDGNLSKHYPREKSSTKCIDDHYVYFNPALTSYWELWQLQGVQNISGRHVPPRCYTSQMPWWPPMMQKRLTALVTSSRVLDIPPAKLDVYMDVSAPVWVAIVYVTLLSLLLLFVFYSFTSQSCLEDNKKNTYGANVAWNTSSIHWLSCSWATPWVAKWGNEENADITKVKADEVSPLGGEDDTVAVQYAKFEQLWAAEIKEVGLQKADLYKVVKQLLGKWRIFANFSGQLVLESTFYFVPPLCVQFASGCLEEYYMRLDDGESVGVDEVTYRCVLFIAVLTGFPILLMFARGFANLTNARISSNVTGALSMAVFDKALRLPLSSVEELAKSSEAAGAQDASTSADGRTPEKDAFEDKEVTQEAEQVVKYHLAQLVMNDINDAITKGQWQITRGVAFMPVITALFIYTGFQLGTAALYVSLFMIISTIGVLFLVVNMADVLGRLFFAQGARLAAFQNYAFGIRFIKSSGSEEIVQDRLTEARNSEITLLGEYFNRLGWLYGVITAFPRFLIVIAFIAYIMIYGYIRATSIMLFVPLVSLLNLSLGAIMDLLPAVAAGLASIQRVEHFLKMPDSPGMHLRDDSLDEISPCSVVPNFIELWPKEGDMPLVVKGDFSWNQDSAPILKGLDITIPRGSLVAVVGAVGSGKTTFLHGILGELYPQGKAEVKRPKVMAYSAQVANIIEGNLKSNVLFGYEYDEERFKEVIHNSCLIPDIEMLPGGEEVPVGSRGISLSGGQKARVSIARAAYSMDTDVVLLDDPFAAVDTHTSEFIAKHYLRSKAMEGRTRIVVCQPEASLIDRFDMVLVIEDGKVKEKGTPYQVMRTRAYKELLASVSVGSGKAKSTEEDAGGGAQTKNPSDGKTSLREEENQGRAGWSTVKFFLRMGGYWRFAGNFVCLTISAAIGQAVMLVLSAWVSATAAAESNLGPPVDHYYYIWLQFGITIISIVFFLISWILGVKFSLSLSRQVHEDVLHNILHAPVDRFFDRTPVGRIVNRMTTDMLSVDRELFMQVNNSLGMITGMIFPLLLVHLVTPWWFTLACLPGYIYCIILTNRYYATMVPIRYLTTTVRSFVDVELSEVENSNATVRAYNQCNERIKKFQEVMDDHIKCDFSTIAVLEQWMVIRMFIFGAGLQTSLGLLALLVPQCWDLGLANVAISNVVTVLIAIQFFVRETCQVQYEFIALNRVQEYTNLPKEKDFVVKGDYRYTNFQVKIADRADLGHLRMKGTSKEGIQIFRESHNRAEEVLLQQVPCQAAFKAFAPRAESPKTLNVLGLRGKYEFDEGHRIVAVNGIRGNAEKMAKELCRLDALSGPLSLHIVSGWLADGAQVEIEGLVAGYADMPQNVLHNMSVTIPRRTKAGFVGKTGCGKSTTILCMVRILEPRAGRIKIEGVDTTTIGLTTLRQAIGLVPQDPTLMVGTLRSNLDMFGLYSDESIWQALSDMQLVDYVKSQKDGLDMEIAGDGGNLSFGQRQLLCLARMSLQQPALLLLDEATSAVDPATQQLVQQTIEQRFPNSTMIVIAHRLETIINFDMVVVLQAGRIVEKGPVKQLARQSGGVFAGMLAARRK